MSLPSESLPVQQKPKNVSDRLWQKFNELREKREAITRVSTQRRIDRLKDDIITSVARSLGDPEEVKAVLGDVATSEAHSRLDRHSRKLKNPAAASSVPSGSCDGRRTVCLDSSSSRGAGASAAVGKAARVAEEPQADNADLSRWTSIRGFLEHGDRARGAPLPTTSCAGHASKPRSGLEERLEEAISARDFAEAEKLSDHLSTRQLGEKIAAAIDAHDFTEASVEAAEVKDRTSKKRKKKLKWGFEPKKRWEMKANM